VSVGHLPIAAVKTLKLVNCGYLGGNTMNTHRLETITLIRIQNLVLFLMHCAPVLWIIMLDYHVAALNVLCFCLTLNGRTFEVLKKLDAANDC